MGREAAGYHCLLLSKELLPAWSWKAPPFWKICWVFLGRRQQGAARAQHHKNMSMSGTVRPVTSAVPLQYHKATPSSSTSTAAKPGMAAAPLQDLGTPALYPVDTNTPVPPLQDPCTPVVPLLGPSTPAVPLMKHRQDLPAISAPRTASGERYWPQWSHTSLEQLNPQAPPQQRAASPCCHCC
uniref:Uncharacterized protein n=1 Tax=Molossus molossus TaxID=27622 RepID=A0A7J8CRW4_MOLMO|nr:hypothetical protein HJG59_009782 [Molossus molossus]